MSAALKRKLTALTCLICVIVTVCFPFHQGKAEIIDDSRASFPQLLGSGEDHSRGLALSIDNILPRVVTSADQVKLSGTITNKSQSHITAVRFIVLTQTGPMSTVTDISSYLSAQSPAGYIAWQENQTISLEPGQSTSYSIHVPAPYFSLESPNDWGPRGISVAAYSGELSGSDRTLMIWDSGTDIDPVKVSYLLPWTSQLTTRSEDGTPAHSLPLLRSRLLSLTQIPGATLAIDPSVIPTHTQRRPQISPDTSTPSGEAAASSSYFSLTPEQRTFWSQLLQRNSSFIALPPYDADMGLPAATTSETLWSLIRESTSDLSHSLENIAHTVNTPESASQHTSQTNETPSTAPQSTNAQSDRKNPADTEPESTQPNTSQSGSTPTTQKSFIALPHIITDVAWSPTSFALPLTQRMAKGTTIAPRGDLRSDTELIGASRVEITPSGTTSTQTPSTDTSTVLTSISDVVDLMAWTPDTTEHACDQKQVITAITALIARQNNPTEKTLFIPFDRDTVLDPELIDRLTVMGSQRWVNPISFDDMRNTSPSSLARPVVPETPPSTHKLTTTTTIGQSVEHASTIFRALEDSTSAWNMLKGPVLSAFTPTLSDSSQATQSLVLSQKVNKWASAISVESSTTINLINKKASFPIVVRNNLPWAVQLKVTLTPSDPRLHVLSDTLVTVPSQAAATAEVPVEAIGSGNISVTYIVSTPEGVVLNNATHATVRMRASWEDAATAVIATLFALLFVVGLIRTIKRRRKSAQPADTHDESPQTSDCLCLTSAQDTSESGVAQGNHEQSNGENL
ncbi:DUF6049 family protein [Schaalia sp. lx-260]|uniref:DUF6049 family protein n=1 Tax=Schaalia sp. lx-260 TaxID=2899082 RepID=UPI001E5174DF|nr:DUF6049 family protein [Schaalia sp. lx-260]MCD4550084.1 DUF6049 family protein [Schaalia sp. lx-260]